MTEENSTVHLLVVDDNPLHLSLLADALQKTYHVHRATNGREALDCALSQPIDLIISDIIMPEMDGIAFYKALLSHDETRNIPIIFVSSLSDIDAKVKLIDLGASDYITKPYSIEEVKARLHSQLHRLFRQRHLESSLHSLSRSLKTHIHDVDSVYTRFHETIVNIALAKNKEPAAHIERIKRYFAQLLRKYLQLYCRHPGCEIENTPNLVEQITKAAAAHDIGMISIPDSIFRKPGRLNVEEYEFVKKHPLLGYEMLEETTGFTTYSPTLQYTREIVRSHHERWDGLGYPDGLAGRAIPLSARLLSIADIYDALTAKRIYKEPVSHKEATGIILAEAGKSLDPQLVDIFLNEHHAFAEISREYPDD